MYINSLALTHFRNFDEVEVMPGRNINLLVGQNGSGKTSFLEAIYCLGFGRSFRPASVRQLIQHEHDAYTIFSRVDGSESEGQHQLGFRRLSTGEVELKIDRQKEKRFAELAKLVPVQLMTPESIELILGGPKVRRQFIDWGVFHVEHQFYQDWVQFSRVLKQRNSLLKQRRGTQSAEMTYWNDSFAQLGERVQSYRDEYMTAIAPQLKNYCEAFLPQYQFRFDLRSGWSQDISLADALHRSAEQDQRYGHSTVGPHKAEIRMFANDEDVKVILSRGQMKLLVAALKLAQGEFLYKKVSRRCIYLVDDITAELDSNSQQKFCSALAESQSQVFVTAIQLEALMDAFPTAETKMFHVEHGIIKEIQRN